jgi:hypothetical protein
MNEEEVKTRIVLPLLERFGVDPTEISLEKSFTLKVGRYTYRVDTEAQINMAQPRLDLLISRNGKNLFVIETKPEGHRLTKADRDQAISYARLVHPIAPYAVTTNGNETQIYDTVSKKLFDPEDHNFTGGYEVTLSEELQYEAQRLFLGFSEKNLHAFCTAQAEANLQPLIGSKQERSRKYIPELHTPRHALLQSVNAFLSSENPFYVVLGSSGMGKTSSFCHLTRHLLDCDESVLFFKGNTLEKGLLEEIGREFDWGFSNSDSHSSVSKVLQRVEAVLNGRRMIVVVDAIDEWTYPRKIQSLARLVTHLASSPLKLILSCKMNAWSQFLEQLGTPTGIAEFVYRDSDADSDILPGYSLPPWDGGEFHETLERYREFYSFQGYFEDKVLEEARNNPFLLRVFFEVAESSNLDNLLFSSREFFDEYYRQLTKKTSDPHRARRELRAVAEALFKANTDSLDVDQLNENIGLALDASLMPELFEHNILERIELNGKECIGFYFQELRDYIITFYVVKWHEASIEEFSRSVNALQEGGLHQEILHFFYRQGDVSKNCILDGEIRAVIEKYLDFYIAVLQEHFPHLRGRFSPYTKAEIGFVSTVNLKDQRLGYYGFRELRNPISERILLLPLREDKLWRSNLPHLHGVDQVHASEFAYDYARIDVETEVLNNEIARQLKGIIDSGWLDESVSEEMSAEMLAAVVARHPSIFSHHTGSAGTSDIFPIVFEEVRKSLLRRRLEKHFRDERVNYKRRQGLIQETWKGDVVSYSESLDLADLQWIEENVQAALAKGEEVKSGWREEPYARIEYRVESCLNLLSSKMMCIQEPLFPWLYSSKSQRHSLVSDTEMVNHSLKVFELFLMTYKKIVERNFPTLCQGFALYAKMPLVCFFHLRQFYTRVEPSGGIGWRPSIRIWFCKNPRHDGENHVILCSEEEVRWERPDTCVWYEGTAYEWFYTADPSWDDFVACRRRFSDVDIAPTAILRGMIYRQIEKELNGALDLLFEKYGSRRTRDL